MKKLVLIASVLFTMSFVSCGISDTTKNTNDSINVDSTSVTVDSVSVDSTVGETTVNDSVEIK